MNIGGDGSWSISSKSDPRWNSSGRGWCGGLICPPEAEKRVDELKKLLGEPPDDLEYSYMKD